MAASRRRVVTLKSDQRHQARKPWAEDVKRTSSSKGRRRTLVSTRRQLLRAVEDEDELVAVGVVDPTHVPLPLGRCRGVERFATSPEQGVEREATGGRRRSIARDASAATARGLWLRRTRGATPASRTLY